MIKETIMELKNVTRYTPDDPDYDNNFLYFRSEDGQDFMSR